MKVFIIIPLLLLCNFATSQQTEILKEDFNDGFPDDWVHYYSSWGGQHYAIDSGALRENDGPFFAPVTHKVELPAVDLSSVSEPFFEFDLAMAVAGPAVRFSILYTTDTSWHTLISYSDTATNITIHTAFDNKWRPSATDYETISIDLAQLKNDTNVRFNFVYEYLNATASAVWYIDNVRIFDNSPIGINEQATPFSFRLFPNPASNIIHIVPSVPAKNATIKITSITGELFLEKVVDSDTVELDLSAYPSGIYSIHYTHFNKTIVKTLVIL